MAIPTGEPTYLALCAVTGMQVEAPLEYPLLLSVVKMARTSWNVSAPPCLKQQRFDDAPQIVLGR